MDKKLRQAQLKALEIFEGGAGHFALCGGTALELYYLKHRFSVDLDFFSPVFDINEIERLTGLFAKGFKCKVKLEAELSLPSMARVRFYTIPVKGATRPLKLDFAEEVMIKEPRIENHKGVRVYSAEDIYFLKITTVTGSRATFDETGRETMQGRNKARDAFDIYMLSKKIKPLHVFLKKMPRQFQRGMVHWYRSFSRQDLKLELLDLDIYLKDFDSSKMISYLEKEIKQFMEKEML